MATVVLLAVATTSLTIGVRGSNGALPPPVRQASMPSAHPRHSLSAVARQADLVVARAVPVFLRVPAIDLAVSLSTLGLNPNGTVQVPTDFAQPGWYRLGPSPGQVGSAVILGHVDSYQGPAVFFKLRLLQVGDTVEVTLADGVIARFAVTNLVMYPRSQFPSQQVYASHGYPALQLVTCGGQFDSSTRHYLSNIVVYTTLVAATPPTGAAPAATGSASQG